MSLLPGLVQQYVNIELCFISYRILVSAARVTDAVSPRRRQPTRVRQTNRQKGITTRVGSSECVCQMAIGRSVSVRVAVVYGTVTQRWPSYCIVAVRFFLCTHS